MKRSWFAAALLCALSFCHWVGATATHAAELVYVTCRALKNLVLDGFKLATGDAEDCKAPKVWLIRAKAFVLRLAKRERPEVSGSWRMCPST